MAYYVSGNGQALEAVGDAFLVPDGFREVTAEEYRAALGAVVLALPEAVAPQKPEEMPTGRRSTKRRQ
ncbi:hypothetical protein [Kitasatospora sp. NPDC058046]|uniref:hypothetical protein n=1 Tax=Kitasatospora sp. NPDC058046 TaxID=3346312 RepID=UPI0036DD3AF9